jgi:4-aminobutyrate aminotransferase-like enzyme
MSRVGIHENVLRISPPMIVTKEQIDTFLEGMDESLAAV